MSAASTWLVVIEAIYDSEDDAMNAMEAMTIPVARDGATIVARYDYGERSKYDAARPAASALQDLFDPVATDEFYRAWPRKLTVTSEWVDV